LSLARRLLAPPARRTEASLQRSVARLSAPRPDPAADIKPLHSILWNCRSIRECATRDAAGARALRDAPSLPARTALQGFSSSASSRSATPSTSTSWRQPSVFRPSPTQTCWARRSSTCMCARRGDAALLMTARDFADPTQRRTTLCATSCTGARVAHRLSYAPAGGPPLPLPLSWRA